MTRETMTPKTTKRRPGRPPTRGETATKALLIRMTEAEHTGAKDLAAARRTDVSTMVRAWLALGAPMPPEAVSVTIPAPPHLAKWADGGGFDIAVVLTRNGKPCAKDPGSDPGCINDPIDEDEIELLRGLLAAYDMEGREPTGPRGNGPEATSEEHAAPTVAPTVADASTTPRRSRKAPRNAKPSKASSATARRNMKPSKGRRTK
jgi:hypothetical protein